MGSGNYAGIFSRALCRRTITNYFSISGGYHHYQVSSLASRRYSNVNKRCALRFICKRRQSQSELYRFWRFQQAGKSGIGIFLVWFALFPGGNRYLLHLELIQSFELNEKIWWNDYLAVWKGLLRRAGIIYYLKRAQGNR